METTTPPSNGTADAFPKKSLEAVDIVVLVLYFIFVMAVGLWVRKKKKWRKTPLQRQTTQGLFVVCHHGDTYPCIGAVYTL
ncbi:hypothetical protein GDO81_020286 [Engystomops pustulosus]|uniref:Uncharacterized protein n=1 Tax=Engystomops pustulosus TaxID=76066 RepID=A0AAV6YQZ2_ENGPU|nr:hypothetical protein GDO81_020286 [Engystomops pustulosus]